MEWKKDFDVLEWWRKECLKYLIFFRVVCDIFFILIFCGMLICVYVVDKRECFEFIVVLEGKFLNVMMCGESWLVILIWLSCYFEM